MLRTIPSLMMAQRAEALGGAFAAGFPAEALAEQQGAINLLAEGHTVPQMFKRLEAYKAAAWAVCRKARPGAAVSSACRILAESSAVRFH